MTLARPYTNLRAMVLSSRVITREADLVTAHEFGHNWGSEHDPDSAECSPSASQVN